MPHPKAPSVRNDDPNMRGQRSRNEGGALRRKRDDTHAGTIEKQYDIDLNVRSDKTLRTILKDEGVDSLSDLVEKKR